MVTATEIIWPLYVSVLKKFHFQLTTLYQLAGVDKFCCSREDVNVLSVLKHIIAKTFHKMGTLRNVK